MHSITKNIPTIPPDQDLCVPKSNISHLNWQQITLQFEPAVVLDVVLDDKHILFNNVIDNKLTVQSFIINPDTHPPNYKNKTQHDGLPDFLKKSDIKNYTGIGTIVARLCYSQEGIDKKDVVLAHPIDNTFSTYPVMNELVQIVEYLGTYYYTNKLQYEPAKFVNSNADFRLESTYGKNNGNVDYDGKEIKGVKSFFCTTDSKLKDEVSGVLGNYFKFNSRLRYLRRREGDTIIESRFGQSIRFGAYDDNRKNDIGTGADYDDGGGNPFILIRNRQRLLAKDKEQQLHKRLNKIKDIKSSMNEHDATGYIIEDLNNDGSSIHITSGLTESPFLTTCYKTIFSYDINEEQPAFSPVKCTTFKMPKLDGNQIIIHSDRLIFASRFGETFHFSKKRYSICTDDEWVLDAHKQIVLNTNTKVVINSPAIYLGEYDNTNEPVILGQTAADWLYDLCNWILTHTHWYKHNHPPSGGPSPKNTQLPVELQQLIQIRDRIHTMLSRRVFVVGGGYAPGHNGGKITDGDEPVIITKMDGETSSEGIPGKWKSKNSRKLNK